MFKILILPKVKSQELQKWSFSYKFIFEVLCKKGKGKSFFEGKRLVLFSDVEKGKGKSFSEGKKLILFSDVEKGKRQIIF